MIKLKKYTHLTLEEREKLFAWKEKGLSIREIAKKLGRSHSTLSRELKRNIKYDSGYIPCIAQRRYERIAKKQRYKAPLKSPEILLYVREHLRPPYFWSPEIISGRLALETGGKLTVTPECIYQYIYSSKNRKDELWKYLPSKRVKRRKKLGRRVLRKGKAPNAVSISKRPKYIQKRRQRGHWETDNMEGPRHSKPALSVTRERAIRFTKITKLPNQTMDKKSKAVIRELNMFPESLVRTITQDNGKENYAHENTAKELGAKMYFCHPYTSCEKGGVERAIKDIRRFIPKGTPLDSISTKEIQWVEDWLNNKPMKCLGFMTPYEKMCQELNRIGKT